MLEDLKQAVYEANMELPRRSLVLYTWGNVSAIDREKGLVVIKPSGIAYDEMRPEDMVVVDLAGNVVEGKLNPSSDTPTHLVLYREYDEIGGIVHTHSTWATVWAQLGKSIKPHGTTHADYFFGNISCTRKLNVTEINNDYEVETGKVIVETLTGQNVVYCPGILVNDHGPFTWGKDAKEAVYHAAVLEQVAKMAYFTELMEPALEVKRALLNKHFMRKHGKNAYYGQGK